MSDRWPAYELHGTHAPYFTNKLLIAYRHLASDSNNGVHQLVLNLLRSAGVMATNEVLTTHLTRVWKKYISGV